MHVAASFEFELCRVELHFVGNQLHCPPRPRSGQADVVPVDSRGPACQALVARVTDKPQAWVGLVGNLCQRPGEVLQIAWRHEGLPVSEFEIRD